MPEPLNHGEYRAASTRREPNRAASGSDPTHVSVSIGNRRTHQARNSMLRDDYEKMKVSDPPLKALRKARQGWHIYSFAIPRPTKLREERQIPDVAGLPRRSQAKAGGCDFCGRGSTNILRRWRWER